MMTTRLLLLASFAPALLLGGCMGTQNRGLESVHQPVVARADYALDLGVAGNGLAPGESTRLAGWLQTMRLGYGDRVAVDDPAGAAPGVREEVADAVARRGLLLSDDTPVTPAPLTPGTIRVVVSRARASVPGCPDWSRDDTHEFEGNSSSNHGCAINTNLAMMVANPLDLVRGQAGADTVDPAVSAKAIDAYRKSTPTGGGGTKVVAQTTGGKQ